MLFGLHGRSPARLVVGIVATAALALTAFAPRAFAGTQDLVISQVYGGGGNAGSVYKNDFIELHNRGASSVSLAGWSVQYASSATGTTWAVTRFRAPSRPAATTSCRRRRAPAARPACRRPTRSARSP